MQTLKFKIKHSYEKQILQYQKQYSVVLHTCFNYLNKDLQKNKLGSLFDYKVKNSPLIQKIKSLNNISNLQYYLIQCALSEAYQLVKSYKYWVGQYNAQKKIQIELKNIMIHV